ncbi:hypothetical protein B4N84_15625 [Flavobacterium sp. IR1]|nr:hypothetical protein B4N84_15625 [Flavobacterium sp. IR1]
MKPKVALPASYCMINSSKCTKTTSWRNKVYSKMVFALANGKHGTQMGLWLLHSTIVMVYAPENISDMMKMENW